ncbi:MAG TPA: hypothetical protein DCQ29_01165 [Chitinophagaceae bacterium]|nr:hypothetical protein [Chitinophagaceae bacterium]
MKKTLLLLFFSILMIYVKSQTFKINSGESAEQFVKRTQKLSEVDILKFGRVSNQSQNPIIYGVRADGAGDYIVCILMPVSNSEYKKNIVDTIFTPGGETLKKSNLF